MLSIFRSGPKIMILESIYMKRLKSYLVEDFEAKECEINIAFEKSRENTTIVFLTHRKKEIIKLEDIGDILFLKNEAERVLCTIINDKKYNLVSYSRIAPRIIVMKTFGNTEKVIEQLLKDYNGNVGIFNEILENVNRGTVITFTKSYLSDPVSLSQLHRKSIFINEDYPIVMRQLKTHGLKYLNIGFDNKDWYELTIKIYDSYGEYMLHYQRLIKILEYLEIGFILGEAWGKDAATIFLSVGVYRIRFFTYYEPEYIKKILLGLEYLDDGTRIVDLDLYHKKRKLYWIDVKKKDIESKEDLSKFYREEIFMKLNEKVKEEVLEMEKEILNTRQ